MEKKYQELQNDIDQIIALFDKLKIQIEKLNNLSQSDKDLILAIEYLVNQYNTIRNTLPLFVVEHFGESFQKLIRELIPYLKHDLENNFQANQTEKNQILFTIDQIDDRLKTKDLSMNEIDSLLDKRMQIKMN